MDQNDWNQAKTAQLSDLGISRRSLACGGLASLTTFLLLGGVASAAPRRRARAAIWIDRQEALARTLLDGQLTPRRWMREVESLAKEIDIGELMSELDKAKLRRFARPVTNDPQKTAINFLDARGNPRRIGFATALFEFKPENVVTPHGHRNMVSSHLVVDGSFRVRNFDRLRDDDGAMIIRKTRDYHARLGEISAMSSDEDNIHWFVPDGERAATFDVIITGIDEQLPNYTIEAVDPLAGEKLTDGTIRAPKMSFAASSRKYTAAI